MTTTTYDNIEDLAFAIWQFKANEKAFANKIITKSMYEFAKAELQKSIDRLSVICYSINNKAGDNNGFIENKASIG